MNSGGQGLGGPTGHYREDPHRHRPRQRGPGHPPPAGPRHRAGSVIGIIVLVVVAVVTAVVLIVPAAFWYFGNATTTEAGPGDPGDGPGVIARPPEDPGTTREMTAQRYHLHERPGWDAMVVHVREMQEHYSALHDSGELLRHAPDGRTVDPDYALAFLYILIDLDYANRFGGAAGTDPEELDAVIEGRRAKSDELERRFLAGEPLGIEVSITRGDGSVFHSDGTYAGAAPAGADHPTRAPDPEGAARAFVPWLDGRGTYFTAAAELAGLFGVQIDHNFDNIFTHCTGGALDRWAVIAAVCSHTPDRIYINQDHGNYPESVDDLYWFETVRHELAHLQILERCGTTRPAATESTHYEAVTNSYAVLFLGMDRDLARQVNDGFPEYYTSPESDAAAREIHGGRCD